MSKLSSHRFDATELAARDGIAAVMAQLAAQGLPGGLAGDVELALVEVVNNVVEHGYTGIPVGEVHVEGILADGWLELRVSDTGRPLPDGRLPPFRPPDLKRLRRDLPEGGFGWGLIHRLTDELRYQRDGSRNTLAMRFRLSDRDGSPRRSARHRSRTTP